MSKLKKGGNRNSQPVLDVVIKEAMEFTDEFKSMATAGSIVEEMILAKAWNELNERVIRKKVKPFCARSILD